MIRQPGTRPPRPVLRGPLGPRRNLAGAYTAAAAVAAIPFFVYQPAQRNWDFSEQFRVSTEQRFPFPAATAPVIPFFVRLPQEKRWQEEVALPRQEVTRFPFVQRQHSPIYDPPRAPWFESQGLPVQEPLRFKFPVVAVQTTPFFVYQPEQRRWDWSAEQFKQESIRFPFVQRQHSPLYDPPRSPWVEPLPLPAQEALRFPFPAVVASTPFFVYQPPQRTWFDTNEPIRKAEEFRPFFTQNGLNLPLQTEKWSRVEAEGQPKQYDAWGAFRPFWSPPPVPTGWTSAFSVEKWHRIEAEPFRRVSDNGWEAFRPFAPYGGHCAFNPYAFSEAFASCRPSCAFNAFAFSEAFASCREDHHGGKKKRRKHYVDNAQQIEVLRRILHDAEDLQSEIDDSGFDESPIESTSVSHDEELKKLNLRAESALGRQYASLSVLIETIRIRLQQVDDEEAILLILANLDEDVQIIYG